MGYITCVNVCMFLFLFKALNVTELFIMDLQTASSRMNLSANTTDLVSHSESWTRLQKSILVIILSAEMVVGTLGNAVVLIVKVVCRGQFQCVYWLPFISLTLSDLCCSALIITGSLLAVLTGGQSSPWCEVVSLFKFTFIISSIGSVGLLCLQRYVGPASTGRLFFVIITVACLAFWLSGTVFGVVPVIYDWVRYDPAEMMCAVFWESSYSDMLVYILTAFSLCIFPPLILILVCPLLSWVTNGKNSTSKMDLSSVTPLVVGFYLLCYFPFTLTELILLGKFDLSPSPDWLRTLSSVMAYLNCTLNPIIYCTNQDFREATLALLWTSRKSSSPEPVLTGITKLDV